MVQQIRHAAGQDERIVGLLDYGSSSEGRSDAWSDIDVALFIRDADLPAFERNWKQWAARFGDVLLAYPGADEHPWTVYRAEPVPLRVDYAFHPESQLDIVLTWPNSPISVEAMVWFDKTNGVLSGYVQQIVGQSLRPDDEARAFVKTCGNFWYYLLYAYSKLRHGQVWFARESFNAFALGSLLALLRFESDSLDRWKASSSAWNLERAISPERLARLNECIPSADSDGLKTAMYKTSVFGFEICESISVKRTWTWPIAVGKETIQTLK
jgi:hypothetical protein